jgi:choline kinase
VAAVRAAVLAAGRGVRMGGDKPKTLIPIGDGQALLFHLLAGLKHAGVEDLLVVTGFMPEQVQEFVTEHWGEATYVRNARYASWGNFHSVRVALDQSPGFDVLVVNSDIAVHPDVFSRTLATQGDLVLAVEKRLRLDEEDMRVQLEGRNRLVAIGKDLRLPLSQGEYCGVSLIRDAAGTTYGDIANEIEWSGQTNVYYEDVYARMLPKIDSRAAFVNTGEYAEVDTPSDVEAATRVLATISAEIAG